jgi:hypothetical protein
MGGFMKCLVDGCDSSVRVISLGLCYKHYVRQKTHGTTEIKKYSRGTLEERFWRFVDKKSEDDCWHWTGQLLPNGYGRISLGAKVDGSDGAHRVSCTNKISITQALQQAQERVIDGLITEQKPQRLETPLVERTRA